MGPHRQHSTYLQLICAHLQGIIRSYRQAAQLAVNQVKKLSVDIGGKPEAEKREMLTKCAQTSLNSKLVSEEWWPVNG